MTDNTTLYPFFHVAGKLWIILWKLWSIFLPPFAIASFRIVTCTLSVQQFLL